MCIFITCFCIQFVFAGGFHENDMKKKRSEQLREAIEEKIAIGEFAPGMRLDEAQLSLRFGASRTPLREALIQLASVGIVEIRPRRGAIVAAPDTTSLIEMFEVMAELEGICARLAARRRNSADLKRMHAAHAECARRVDERALDAYYYANEELHLAIYMASHNGYLATQSLQLHRRLRVYRRLQLRVGDRLDNSFSEHASVIEAIESGNADAAAQRMRAHVLVQGERFADLLAWVQLQSAA